VVAITALSLRAVAHSAEEGPTSATNSFETLDSYYLLYQPYQENISSYQPVYFLPGVDLAESKFQISFKYRIFNSEGPLVERYPWLSGLHLGYTQTSIWDLESDSLPFSDTSYKPELFFLTPNLTSDPRGRRGVFLKSGILHESNGKSEDDSRSINIVYVQPTLILYHGKSGYGISVGPRAWGYFNTSSKNSDIADYRGYFDVDLKMGKRDGLMLSSQFGWAEEGGSVYVNMTYPVGKSLFNNINIYLHMQYANALAESLLYYPERTETFRAGVSFVR